MKPPAPIRGGDPTLAQSATTTAEEEFMQVLDEMNRICGGEGQAGEIADTSKAANWPDAAAKSSAAVAAVAAAAAAAAASPSPPNAAHFDSSMLSTSPLEPLFGAASAAVVESSSSPDNSPKNLEPKSSTSSSSPSAAGGSNASSGAAPSALAQAAAARSRHCSANSSLSCVSFDSAIGDVYSTPPRNSCEFDQEVLEQQQKVTTNAPPPSQKTRKQTVVHPNRRVVRPAPYEPPLHLDPITRYHRHEVELVCMDLMGRFQHAATVHPKRLARSWMSDDADPLLITTRLLSDSLARLRLFLYGLDPMYWLCWADRNALYSAQVCSVAILKASVSANLSTLPAAYPLPYGEYLGDVEALHLILAHDLYNELKSLVAQLQCLTGATDLPVMLLVMMVAFFVPQQNLLQPEKVVRVHDYYTHKLQIYLSVRYGPCSSQSLMSSIMSAVCKVRDFSRRLREFLTDVTTCGLQQQYEAVCENIGLIAFLLQAEPLPQPQQPQQQSDKLLLS